MSLIATAASTLVDAAIPTMSVSGAVTTARSASAARPSGRVWTHVGDPAFDAYLRARLQVAVTIAGSHGAQVVLATQPYNRRGEQADGTLFPEDMPTRVTQWNHVLHSVAKAGPGVILADFGRRVSPDNEFSWTAGRFQMRTDGVHLAAEGVQHRIAPWLFRRLLRWAPR